MKQQLQEISNKSQAETIDLWPEIYAEIKEAKPVKSSARIGLTLSRVALVASLVFLGVIVVYAFGQIYVDSGLEGARAERLVTEVDQSVTVGDMTVRLDWVYVDVNRISAGYTILDSEGNVFVPEQDEFIYSAKVWIREMTEPSARGFRPFIGSGGNERAIYNRYAEQQIISDVFWGYQDYYLEGVIGEIVELDFRVVLKGQLYRILVETPFLPAQFEIEHTVMESSNPMEITLRELTITPTMTTVSFCYQWPEIFGNPLLSWVYVEVGAVNLYFDDVNVATLYPNLWYESYPGMFVDTDTAYCTSTYWAIPSDRLPQKIRFEVQELRQNINGEYNEEQSAFLVEQFELHGIEVESYGPFAESGDYGVWPTDIQAMPRLDYQARYNEVMTLFYEQYPEIPRIVGPWEIEFELVEPVN